MLPAPTWSVMIPTFDCARYLADSVGGVLAQDPGPTRMQIEVVDDHSHDDVEETLRSLAGDRVAFFRQPRNLGLVGNLNTCLARARGELVHILHGDDLVRPGFYEAMERLFRSHPQAGLAFCRVTYLDERTGRTEAAPVLQPQAGLLPDAVERIIVDNPLSTAGVVVRRDVYAEAGGFDPRFRCCCEDWEMWSRIALRHPVAYEPADLAFYRMQRPGSLTQRNLRSGAFGADMRKGQAVLETYLHAHLPPEVADRLARRSRDAAAGYLIDHLAPPFFAAGDVAAGLRQLWHAVACRPSLHTLQRAARRALSRPPAPPAGAA